MPQQRQRNVQLSGSGVVRWRQKSENVPFLSKNSLSLFGIQIASLTRRRRWFNFDWWVVTGDGGSLGISGYKKFHWPFNIVGIYFQWTIILILCIIPLSTAIYLHIFYRAQWRGIDSFVLSFPSLPSHSYLPIEISRLYLALILINNHSGDHVTARLLFSRLLLTSFGGVNSFYSEEWTSLQSDLFYVWNFAFSVVS